MKLLRLFLDMESADSSILSDASAAGGLIKTADNSKNNKQREVSMLQS